MACPNSQASPSARHRFTLVELIAGLIMLAVIGAIFAPFLHGLLQKTSDAPTPVQEGAQLVAVMERIANDYDRDASLRTDLALLRDRILAEPSPYGSDFEVVECSFVRFENGQETSGSATDNLKVVIANGSTILASVFPKGGS